MAKSAVKSSFELVVGLTEKKPVRVLHVDDDAGFLKVARQCLEMQGAFEVDTALSVEEAAEKLKAKTFDAVVSDYMMPERDGLEFLKELRKKGNNIPFVMFTGKGREEVAIKTLNLGADGYINKAGDPETVYGELAHGIRQAVKTRRAEEELRKSEEKYRFLYESSPVVNMIIGLDGIIKNVNESLVKSLVYSKDEIIGRHALEFVVPEQREKVVAQLERDFKGEYTPEIDVDICDKDGTIHTLLFSAGQTVLYEEDQPSGVLVTGIDITERKRMEEELQRTNDEQAMLLDAVPAMIFWINKEDKLERVNEAFAAALNKSPDDINGKSLWDLYPEEMARKFHDDNLEVIESGISKRCIEEPVETPAGTMWVSTDKIPHRDEKGDITGIIGFSVDITERKRTEEKLRESEEKYRDVFENARDAVIVLDRKGNITDVNRIVEEYGFKKEDLIGKNMRKLTPKKYWPGLLVNLAAVTRGEPVESIIEVNTSKGKVIVEYRTSPIIQNNKVVGSQTILRDITERKKTETRVTQSEQKYRSLVEMAPDGVATVDMKGVITSVNTAFARLTGYSKDEIVGKHFTKLQTIRARDIPKYLKLMGPALRGKKIPPFEYPYVRKDGTIRWGEAHIGRLKKDGKTIGFQAVLREITKRKQAEKATRESQKKFEQLFMSNPEAAVYVDPDFHVLDVNPCFTELFGYSLDEIQGKHINKVVVPEDKMLEAEGLDNKALKGYVYRDTVRKRKDGSLVPVSVSAAPIVVDGRRVGQVGTYKDISQLKSVEKALRETMIKLAMMNEKLRVVGRLARHDVRNKLSAVTANTYLMKKKVEGDSEAVKRLEDIESAVREATWIFDFARTYEKLGIEKLVYVDVEKTFDGAVQQFSDLQVKVVNDCSGLSVLADSLLTRFFYNLVHNSLMHGENVSKIRVYYEKEEDELKLVYEDDGVGIRKAEKEKVFREGYGKGTGYGLYLIKKMCEVYGWTIRETGKLGKGAEFTITIPKVSMEGKISYKLQK